MSLKNSKLLLNFQISFKISKLFIQNPQQLTIQSENLRLQSMEVRKWQLIRTNMTTNSIYFWFEQFSFAKFILFCDNVKIQKVCQHTSASHDVEFLETLFLSHTKATLFFGGNLS